MNRLEGLDVPLPRWQRKALERSTKKTGARTPAGDRFIPSSRSAHDLDVCRMALSFNTKENASEPSAAERSYQNCLQASMLHSNVTGPASACAPASSAKSDLAGAKILSFKNTIPLAKEGTVNRDSVLFQQARLCPPKRRAAFRSIPSQPEKILDAPGIQEDFYLNLLDWGATGALAVALHDTVYLWNSTTGSIERLCETASERDYVTSVAWSPTGQFLAVGTNSCEVQIWDPAKMARLRTFRQHTRRVASLAWHDATLATGSRDAAIHLNDVRASAPRYATLAAHRQEVCGLRWAPGGKQLASGGNDNAVCVWDAAGARGGGGGGGGGAAWEPRLALREHSAAVKALAWCPLQAHVLATGGGTADRTLRFWNTASGACVRAVDTKSQVSGIAWSPSEMELVTSHGFSNNQLTVWKYPSLARMAELKGHSQRVLQLAQSPDGATVVSAGADETLRFWRVFDASAAGRRSRSSRSLKCESLARQCARPNIR